MERAQALLDHLRKDPAKLHGQTIRELGRRQWSQLATLADMEAAVATLEQYGWVRAVEAPTIGGTRTEVHLHPTLTSVTSGRQEGVL